MSGPGHLPPKNTDATAHWMTRIIQRHPVPWLIGAAVAVGAVQVMCPKVPSSDFLYTGLILLGVLTARTRLVKVAATISSAGTLAHGAFAWHGAPGGTIVANTLMVLTALWATAVLGLAFIRRGQQESELRRERVEHQPLLQRLSISAQTAELWLWESDQQNVASWDMNRPRGLGLEGLGTAEVFTAFNKLIDPDDLREIRSRIYSEMSSGSRTLHYRYRVRALNGMVRHFQMHARVMDDDAMGKGRLFGVTRDITNEVQTMEMLQRQAEQERSLLDRLSIAAKSAGLHCWQFDPRTMQFRWSENSVVELGSAIASPSLEELREYIFQSVAPEDAERVKAALVSSFKQRTDLAVRFRRIMSDGSTRHFQMSGRVICDAHGRSLYTIGANMDITEAVESAARLQEQAERLREFQRRLERAALFSNEGHWEVDLATQKHWVSDGFRALLGHGPDTDFSTSFSHRALVDPSDLIELLGKVQHCTESSEPFESSVRLQHANGEWRWMHVRGNVERDDQGAPVRLSGSLRDVHQQVLMEKELREAHERFARAIRGTQDGLWESDNRTGQMWLAPRVAEIFGFEPEEAAHWDWPTLRERFHPDDMDRINAARERSRQHREKMDLEHRVLNKSGQWIWVRVRATPECDANGQVVRVSGSMHDVTEAHLARDELIKATQEAQAASLAKSAFLANVSHEIRTPMNGIIGMTGLLLDTQLDRTQREYAETVRSSADALLTIINDILDFSKIEAGKLDIEAIEMDLRGNVEDVGSMLGFQAAAKRLELIVNMHADVPDRVIGDPQRIRQCLINLVGNAIKFTRTGEIVIDVHTVGQQGSKVLVNFEVRDTGIGIDADALRTLFQPFVQADSSTTRRFGGTGLGLSIVRRLTELMGGQIGVASEAGKGSVFSFTLPLEHVVSTQRETDIQATQAARRRVLVVDDNATNRRVLAAQLAHHGYHVETAESSAMALTSMRRALGENHPFDVVLVDFQIPDMDGASLGEQINADPHLSHARVVMLTSIDRHGDVGRLAALGFAGYLTKPVRARELLSCLDKVLSRDSHEWHVQTQPIVTRGALQGLTAAGQCRGTVLLVEDNLVNQKVAQRFLKRLNCAVVIANDGAEAVELFKQRAFSLVLMDLQMPVMDGFTATRHMRELQDSRSSTPIVALTANAMAMQMERCLAVGMNDFLTKPLDIERLGGVIDRYCPVPATPTTVEPLSEQAVEAVLTKAGAPTGPIINFELLDALTEGDATFAAELAQAYISSARETIAQMHAQLERDERTQLARAAHRLKGASANIHAQRTQEACARLEAEVTTSSPTRLAQCVAELAACLDATIAELEPLQQRGQPAA